MPRKFVMEPEVDADEFARGLGAKPVGECSEGNLDILDVRHTLQSMLRSRGGRPIDIPQCPNCIPGTGTLKVYSDSTRALYTLEKCPVCNGTGKVKPTHPLLKK